MEPIAKLSMSSSLHLRNPKNPLFMRVSEGFKACILHEFAAKSFKPCNTMALRETSHTADCDIFRQELCNIISLRHPLVQLSHFLVDNNTSKAMKCIPQSRFV